MQESSLPALRKWRPLPGLLDHRQGSSLPSVRLLSFCLSFVQKIEKPELITGILNRSLGESLYKLSSIILKKEALFQMA